MTDIEEGLGAVGLRDLTPLMIERFYAELSRTGGRQGTGLSPKSIRNYHVTLRKALADAERLEVIDRIPASRGTVSVNQSVTTVGTKIVFSPPKSDRSRRRLVLDPDTVRVLVPHRDAQHRDRELLGSPVVRGDAVFADPDAQPIHPDVVTRRFKTLVRQSGLPPLRGPRDLRHTWASLALAAGVHPKVVSDRLGHSTISITIDTYSHAIPTLDADAAATVASQLFKNDEEDEP